jgi:hypothetical protein
MFEIWLKRDDWRPIPQQAASQFPMRPPTQRPAEEEATLAKRIEREWVAFKALDWASIYDMADPTYRSLVTKEDFLKRKSRYVYLAHNLDWVEVFDKQARAKVSFQQKLNDPTLHKLAPTRETAFELWVKVDGEWFRQMQAPPKPQTANKPQGESR